MDRHSRNRWGYVPIVAGLVLIAAGVIILIDHVLLKNELASPNWYFWFYWAPVITFLLIAGALTTVVGVLISRKITSKLSIASVAGGFLLIALDSHSLLVDWIRPMVNGIGPGNFLGWQAGGIAVGFFSWLMAGVFLVVLGVILGLGVRSKLGVASVAWGVVFMILAVCLAMLDAATTIAIDPAGGFQDFRWYYFLG